MNPFRKIQIKKTENLDKVFDFRERKQYFPLKFGSYLKMLIKNQKNLTEEEYLVVKGKNLLEEELDLIEILKKLQDIEKLKKILLNDKQLVLFELLTKPLIDGKEGLLLSERKPRFEKDKIKEIYNELKLKSDNEVDARILDLLDHEVVKYISI